jgi:DHA1 family bicyclomycin/chloramphenicol resistance-like MFS transporter
MLNLFIHGPKSAPPHFLTVVLMAATAAMTMNIFLPSLTAISHEFGISYSIAQLVLSGYLGATAIVQLLIGPLSDRYGRRPVILTSYIFFVSGSIVCLYAPSFEMLLFGRLIQAASITTMALSRAIIRDLFSRTKAASMIGYVTMAMAIGPMLAPVLGGYLQENYSWRASFLLLTIIATAMLFLCIFDLGETNKNKSNNLMVQFRKYGELIREKTLWLYIIAAASGAGVFFSFIGGADYVGRNFLGLTPIKIGFYFIFVSFGYIGGSYMSGRFTERVGLEKMMLIGTSVTVIGVLISIILFSAGNYHPASLFVPMLIVGFGNGMSLPSANAGAVSVRADLAGSAAGLTGCLQVGGGAALSFLAAYFLGPNTGPFPMLAIMLASAVTSLAASALIYQAPRPVEVD